MMLRDAASQFLLSKAGFRSDETTAWYAKRLKRLIEYFGGDYAIERVTVSDLRCWFHELRSRDARWSDHPSRPEQAGGLSVWTLRGYVRAARTFFRWLMLEGLLRANPAERLEMPARPRLPRRGIEDDDADRIIAAARGNARDYALVLVLADTACRVGGLVGLTLADVDMKARRVTVREKGLGGGNLARVIPMSALTLDALRAWLKVRPRIDDDHIFVGCHGQPLTTSGAYQVVKRIARRAGVTLGFNPHNWRHAAARLMLANGASLAQVGRFLGHNSIDVTYFFYGTFSDEEVRQVHAKYSRFAGRLAS